MTPINKLPASAGAQWLLDAFALLRRAPLGLASLSLAGLFMVLLAIIFGFVVAASGAAFPFPLSLLPIAVYFLLTLGVPSLVYAGMIWAVSEVAQGRPALLPHLYRGFGHLRALLVVTLVPSVGALLAGALLLALIGSEGAQQYREVVLKLQELTANGAQPDVAQVQALIATLPVVRIFLWLMACLAIAPFVMCVMLLALPQIVFSDSHGFAAIRNSAVANLRNLPAMIVLVLLLGVLLFAISIFAQVVGFLVQILLGPVAGTLVANMLLVALLMPLLAGVAYSAWKQIFGVPEQAATTPILPPDRIEL